MNAMSFFTLKSTKNATKTLSPADFKIRHKTTTNEIKIDYLEALLKY
jgi:hypothetical protein